MAKRKKRVAGGRKKPIPGWIWLLTGLLIGLAIATAAWLIKEEESAPKPKPVKRPETSSIQIEPAEDEKKVQGDSEKRRYDFYEKLTRDQERPGSTVRESEPTENETQPYYLQVGSFRDQADADELKAKLAFLGLVAEIHSASVEGRNWHRVRLGPFNTRRESESIIRQLREEGFEPIRILATSP